MYYIAHVTRRMCVGEVLGMSLYHWLYERVKMKRWRWVEHIVVGKQGQNRKAWAHLTITSLPVQCFHAVENKVSSW